MLLLQFLGFFSLSISILSCISSIVLFSLDCRIFFLLVSFAVPGARLGSCGLPVYTGHGQVRATPSKPAALCGDFPARLQRRDHQPSSLAANGATYPFQLSLLEHDGDGTRCVSQTKLRGGYVPRDHRRATKRLVKIRHGSPGSLEQFEGHLGKNCRTWRSSLMVKGPAIVVSVWSSVVDPLMIVNR